MSTEFQRTVLELDGIDAKLQQMEANANQQDSNNNNPQFLAALAAQAHLLEEVHTTLSTSLAKGMRVYQKRCTEVNPQTNSTTYGDKMKAKVTEAYKRYETLVQRAVALRDAMDRAVKQTEAARVEAEAQARRAQEAKAQAEARQREEEARRLEAVKMQEMQQQQSEAARQAALEQEAARVREHKLQEWQQQQAAARQALAKAKEEDAALTASVTPGLEGAEAGLAQLQKACGGEASKPYKEAVAALAMYVGNIIAHPEEAVYKKVKEESAHFRSKVGAFGMGGIHILLAAGFQVQREEEMVGEEAVNAAVEGEEEQQMPPAIRGPGPRVFTITEPDITEQKQWTAWYDHVKNVRDRLKAEETRVKRL